MSQTSFANSLTAYQFHDHDFSAIDPDTAVTSTVMILASRFVDRFPLFLTFPEIEEYFETCAMVPDLQNCLWALGASLDAYKSWRNSNKSEAEQKLAIASSKQTLERSRRNPPRLHHLLTPKMTEFPSSAFRDVHNVLGTEIFDATNLPSKLTTIVEKVGELRDALNRFTGLSNAIQASFSVASRFRSFEKGDVCLMNMLGSLKTAQASWLLLAEEEYIRPVTKSWQDRHSWSEEDRIRLFVNRFWGSIHGAIPDKVDEWRGDEQYRQSLRAAGITVPSPGHVTARSGPHTFQQSCKLLYRSAAVSIVAIERLTYDERRMRRRQLAQHRGQGTLRSRGEVPGSFADAGDRRQRAGGASVGGLGWSSIGSAPVRSERDGKIIPRAQASAPSTSSANRQGPSRNINTYSILSTHQESSD